MGPGSATADSCEEWYLNKGTYIQTVKFYFSQGNGIVGSIYVASDSSYKIYGNINGADSTYDFTKD